MRNRANSNESANYMLKLAKIMEGPATEPTPKLEPQIVDRLASLPLVYSTCERLATLYKQTKEANRLLRFALETSELCLRTMTATAVPYVHAPISALDNIACDGLNILQERYPLIKAPSTQVYKETVKPAVDYSMEAVDLAAEQVNAVKKSGAEHVQAANDAVLKARDFTISQICSARDQGIEQVCSTNEQVETIYSYTSNKWEEYSSCTGSETLKEVMESPYGSALSQQLDHSLTWSEKFIEQYLPEIEDLGEYIDEEYSDETETSKLERAIALTNKTKQRLCQHALINLKLIQVRTQEAADKLLFTNDLINYAKTNLAILSSMLSLKLSSIWREINHKKESAADEDETGMHSDAGMEERLIATARHVVHMCNRGVSAVSYGFSVVPAFLTEQFDKLKTYTNDLQELVKVAGGLSEIRSFLVEQAADKLVTYEDNKVYQTARNMMLHCIEKASHLQEKFTESKDYLINTPFMNWVGLNSKEMADQEDIEMEAITS